MLSVLVLLDVLAILSSHYAWHFVEVEVRGRFTVVLSVSCRNRPEFADKGG
jgi:hypothetical protein